MQQYLVYAWDSVDENALERRMNIRPAHFDRARELKAAGNFVIGGAMLNDEGNMIGSMMVVQFATVEELQQWMKTEPYINGKIWGKIEVTPFRVADV